MEIRTCLRAEGSIYSITALWKSNTTENRYYDQYTGRWLTHDPLGITPNPQKPNIFDMIGQYRDGLGLYEYVRSCPILQRDPHGLLQWTPGGPGFGPPIGSSGGGSPGAPIGGGGIAKCPKEAPKNDPWFCEDTLDVLMLWVGCVAGCSTVRGGCGVAPCVYGCVAAVVGGHTAGLILGCLL